MAIDLPGILQFFSNFGLTSATSGNIDLGNRQLNSSVHIRKSHEEVCEKKNTSSFETPFSPRSLANVDLASGSRLSNLLALLPALQRGQQALLPALHFAASVLANRTAS